MNVPATPHFFTVNVLPAPDIIAGPDTIVYSNHPVQMYAEGGISYVWDPTFWFR
jgi:hypothetical protein